MLSELKFAFRQLVKAPGFTAIAVLSLAVGIGINTTIFSAMDAAFLRPLPVANPAEYVRFEYPRLTLREFEDLRAGMKSLAGALASAEAQLLLQSRERLEPVNARFVSGNYFTLLGVAPAAGRLFSERSPDLAGPIAVISDGLWERKFGRDAGVVGATVTIRGRSVAVVGVAAPGFLGENRIPPTEIWLPAASWPGEAVGRQFHVIGRLVPGFSAAQAQAEATTIFARPEWSHVGPDRSGRRVLVWSERKSRMDHGGRLAYLMGPIVGLVLLVACANVSCLLLGRHEERRRDIAVRLALGAGRARVMGSLLVEGLLLALAGGALALLFTSWGLGAIPALFPARVAHWLPPLTADVHTLALTFGLSLFATLVFGLAPALRATRLDVAAMLKAGGARLGRLPSRSILVVVQVMIAMVFLAVAALFVRAFVAGSERDLGFTERNVLFAGVTTRHRVGRDLAPLLDEIRRTVGSLPGVRGVTLANGVLGGQPFQVRAPGDDVSGNAAGRPMLCNLVDPGYFAALGIPLLQGRDFAAHDDRAGGRVAIVSESVARHFWPGQNPVGQTFFAGRTELAPREVVGVVRDAAILGDHIRTEPMFYLPLRQDSGGSLMLIVNTRQAPGKLAAPIRRALGRMDSSMTAFAFDTVPDMLRLAMLPQWILAWLGGVLGGLAFVLAVTGLYGVVAYAMARRTRELGIRIAIGAAPRDAVWLMLRQGLGLALIGVFLGLPVAVGVGVALRSGLYGTSPADPLALAGASILVVTVATLASYMPARRAARIDPVEALRDE